MKPFGRLLLSLLIILAGFYYLQSDDGSGTSQDAASGGGTGTGTGTGTGEAPKTGVYFSFSNNKDVTSLGQNAYFNESITPNITLSSSNEMSSRDETSIGEDTKGINSSNELTYDFRGFAYLTCGFDYSRVLYSSNYDNATNIENNLLTGLVLKPYDGLNVNGRIAHGGTKYFYSDMSDEVDLGKSGSFGSTYQKDISSRTKIAFGYNNVFAYRELTNQNTHTLNGNFTEEIVQGYSFSYSVNQSYHHEVNRDSRRDGESRGYVSSINYILPLAITGSLSYGYNVQSDTTGTDTTTSSTSFNKYLNQNLSASLRYAPFSDLDINTSLSRQFGRRSYTTSINDYDSETKGLTASVAYRMMPLGSLDFSRSINLEQLFMQDLRNENDRDVYGSNTALRITFNPASILILSLSLGGEESAFRYIRSAHSADNKTTTAYQIAPGLTFNPSSKISITETFNIKATYTTYDNRAYAPTDDYLYRLWGVYYGFNYTFTEKWATEALTYGHNQSDEGVYSHTSWNNKDTYFPSTKRKEDAISMSIDLSPSKKWKNSLGGGLDWNTRYSNEDNGWEIIPNGKTLDKTLSFTTEYSFSTYWRFMLNAGRVFPQDEEAYWQFSMGLSYSPYLK